MLEITFCPERSEAVEESADLLPTSGLLLRVPVPVLDRRRGEKQRVDGERSGRISIVRTDLVSLPRSLL